MPDWTPSFPGQRPPFQPGHTLSMQHGAKSPRRVHPLATQFVERLLADSTVPAYVREERYAAEVWAWARAEAQVRLLEHYLIGQAEQAGDSDGLPDLDEDRVRSAYSLLDKAEKRAASARSRLGLTPTSAARLGRDVAVAQNLDVARSMQEIARLEAAGWTPPTDHRSDDDRGADE